MSRCKGLWLSVVFFVSFSSGSQSSAIEYYQNLGCSVRALLHRRDFIGPGYDTATSQVHKVLILVSRIFRCL